MREERTAASPRSPRQRPSAALHMSRDSFGIRRIILACSLGAAIAAQLVGAAPVAAASYTVAPSGNSWSAVSPDGNSWSFAAE